MFSFDIYFFFFFNDTATTEIYTLSLHDALPISDWARFDRRHGVGRADRAVDKRRDCIRSEEHTSELQSHSDLVCRLLLEKKKKKLYQSHAYVSITERSYVRTTMHCTQCEYILA